MDYAVLALFCLIFALMVGIALYIIQGRVRDVQDTIRSETARMERRIEGAESSARKAAIYSETAVAGMQRVEASACRRAAEAGAGERPPVVVIVATDLAQAAHAPGRRGPFS